MLGRHAIKSWSSTQTGGRKLSSGEAEQMAMAKGATEAIGLSQIFEEWGRTKSIEIRTDSSAAVGTVHRVGNSKSRHVRISDLWLQERVKEGTITVTKIAGAENLADMMTKNATKGVRESLLQKAPFSFELQQSEKQPRISFLEEVKEGNHCRHPQPTCRALGLAPPGIHPTS